MSFSSFVDSRERDIITILNTNVGHHNRFITKSFQWFVLKIYPAWVSFPIYDSIHFFWEQGKIQVLIR